MNEHVINPVSQKESGAYDSARHDPPESGMEVASDNVSDAAANASWLGPIQFAEGMCHEATVSVCRVAIALCLPAVADHAYDSAGASRCAEAHAVAVAGSKPGNASIAPHGELGSGDANMTLIPTWQLPHLPSSQRFAS